MLYAEGLLTPLLRHLKLSNLISTIPFEYNRKRECFQEKSAKKLLIHKYRLRFAYLISCFLFLQIIWTWNQSNIFLKLHTVFNYTGFVTLCYSHHVFYSKRKEIVSLVNGMLRFEKMRNGKGHC